MIPFTRSFVLDQIEKRKDLIRKERIEKGADYIGMVPFNRLERMQFGILKNTTYEDKIIFLSFAEAGFLKITRSETNNRKYLEDFINTIKEELP